MFQITNNQSIVVSSKYLVSDFGMTFGKLLMGVEELRCSVTLLHKGIAEKRSECVSMWVSCTASPGCRINISILWRSQIVTFFYKYRYFINVTITQITLITTILTCSIWTHSSAFSTDSPYRPAGEMSVLRLAKHAVSKDGPTRFAIWLHVALLARQVPRRHANGRGDGAATEQRRLRRQRAWRAQTHSEDLQPEADTLCPHCCTSRRLPSLWSGREG